MCPCGHLLMWACAHVPMGGPTGVVPSGCVGGICHVVEARSLTRCTGLVRGCIHERMFTWSDGHMHREFICSCGHVLMGAGGPGWKREPRLPAWAGAGSGTGVSTERRRYFFRRSCPQGRFILMVRRVLPFNPGIVSGSNRISSTQNFFPPHGACSINQV